MADLLKVSSTGLQAAQAALRVTGHNIANTDTTGFSRQQVSADTLPANSTSAGYIGNGVTISSVERIVNSFVTEQLREDTSLHSELEAYKLNVSQVNTLLSDTSTGLTEGLQSFFSSLQNAADDPSSVPTRQLVLSESENLVTRFHTLQDRLDSIGGGVGTQMDVAVNNINSLTESIAQLNQKISKSLGSSGDQPNDLLDQRDEAIRELSELVSVQVFDQGGGMVSLAIGNGQMLVIGGEARSMSLVAGPDNGAKKELALTTLQGNKIISDQIHGGELGGLFDFRDGVLNDAYNELGRVALVLSSEVNTISNAGINLNNEFGDDFFKDINNEESSGRRVIGSSDNAPPDNRETSLTITDTSELTGSDYEIVISANDNLYTVTRLSDSEEVATGLISGGFPYTISFDGVEFSFDAGTYKTGDSFLVRPTHDAARDIEFLVSSAEDLAFALPLVSDASLSNSGSGDISEGELLSLIDSSGNDLPMFAKSGVMDPPLLIQFTSETTYDVLDNSDPGNPVQLDPPIRNQTYVPGQNNNIFSDDPHQTVAIANGPVLGLPEGSSAAIAASLQVTPAIVFDFSSTANFSFDVAVINTAGGLDDAVLSITIDNSASAINSTDDLLQNINSQLGGSDVTAYISDTGSLSFRINTVGAGDITLTTVGVAPAGSNELVGFDIEAAASFTSVAGVDGVSGGGKANNGYPSEVVTVETAANSKTSEVSSETILLPTNASAKEMAAHMNTLTGVHANASNYIEISDLALSYEWPTQLSINGEDLLEYRIDPGFDNPVLSSDVPDPNDDPIAFNNYVAERINSNDALSALGISAVGGTDPVTGRLELRIFSSQGDDLTVELEASSGDSLAVSDGTDNPSVTMRGAGNSTASTLVVGGRFDVQMDEGVSLSGLPSNSMLFGDTTAANFQSSTYLGIQVSINGHPDTGDTFSISFNDDARSDNRNALSFVDLEVTNVINGTKSLDEGYSTLVEKIGIKTSTINMNTEAAEQVLQHTEDLRSSVSGVNLDEEAANLIRYEQAYNANAQVISVARDLFDRLLSSF